MTIAIPALLETLVTLDYDDEVTVTIPGEFSRRGGIVDIFSPAHDEPCRIEFFGDEIDSLRAFSPENQRSTGKLDSYRVINRAGITAGGAAESDLFEYLELVFHKHVNQPVDREYSFLFLSSQHNLFQF